VSFLPELLTSQQNNPFLQQVAEVSPAAIKAYGVISFGMIKGFFAISAKGMLCRAFVCPRCRGTPFYMLHMGGLLWGIRVSRARQP
jgi:hypothetical protein